MLVVHGTPLVAEDLRDMLMSSGARAVELAPALPETPPAEPFDTCVLAVSSRDWPDAGLPARAARMAAHVVLIMGFPRPDLRLPPHVAVLAEPFRDADVLAALTAAWRGPGDPA